MKYHLKVLLVLALLLINVTTHAQDNSSTHDAANHGLKGTSRLTLGLGHTHVSEGQKDGKTQWLALPSWSINFDYWLNNKWAIGLQNDIILESFVIEDQGNELIERSYPVSMVPVAIYKSGNHLSFIGGVGAEYSKGHTLALTRLGIEYGFHLDKNWEIGTALVWDRKWNYYNSWGLAITISKLWSSKKHHKI